MTVETEKHLYELIRDFPVAMVVTRGAGGIIHARPMAVAQLKPDAEVYFATSLDTPKVAEIEADPRVAITFQSPAGYAALNGTAVVVRDKALIDQLWSEAWRVWFPLGKDDPTLCLLRVTAHSGEYWDRGGTNRLKYLFEGLKAVLQGTTPDVDDDPSQHAKVQMGARR